MDFTFTEEQQLLRDSLRGYLRSHYGFDHRRARAAAKAVGMRTRGAPSQTGSAY